MLAMVSVVASVMATAVVVVVVVAVTVAAVAAVVLRSLTMTFNRSVAMELKVPQIQRSYTETLDLK